MAAPRDIRSPLEHDKRLVALLGTMAARWTLVEGCMMHLFSEMLRDEPAARAIYQAANSFRTRVEIIRETAWVFCIYESDWEQISKLLSDTYDAFKVRSTLIHQPYHAEVDDATVGSALAPFITDDDKNVRGLGTFSRRGYFETDDYFRSVNRGTLLNHIQRVGRLLNSFAAIFDGITAGHIKFRTIGGSLSEMHEEHPLLPLDKKP